MSFTTYAELITNIQDWLHRANISSPAENFVTLAEAKFNRKLRLSAMETRATTTLAAGDEYIALPSRFLEMRNLQLNTNPVTSLEYMTPEIMDRRYGGVTGAPLFYAVIADQIQVAPVAAADYEIEMTFYRAFAPLSQESNWLFENHPDIYLYGAMMEAAPYMKDDKALARWGSFYNPIMDDLMKSNDRLKWSGSAMQMRTF